MGDPGPVLLGLSSIALMDSFRLCRVADLVSLIAGLTGVSFTRSFWSTYERMQGIFDLAHWFAFVLMAGSVFRSVRDWQVPFTVNLIIGAVVSALGVGHHFDVFSIDILGSSQRIESTLGNATYVGAYTMVNAMIGLGLIVHSFDKAGDRAERGSEEACDEAQAAQSCRARRLVTRPHNVASTLLDGGGCHQPVGAVADWHTRGNSGDGRRGRCLRGGLSTLGEHEGRQMGMLWALSSPRSSRSRSWL